MDLKVYLSDVRGGKEKSIDLILPSSFIEVDESDLKFEDPVLIKGKFSLTRDHLVICLSIETSCSIPCSICNESVSVGVTIPKLCHAEEIEKIKGSLYDGAPLVREAILLEVPPLCGMSRKVL